MKKPKKVIITGHYGNELAKETAKKVVELLHNRGIEFEVDISFGIDAKTQKPISELDGDIALAFGGDGTVLYAVAGIKSGIPVLGINCGRRGALSACDAAYAEECAKKALMGKYDVEERIRIEVEVDGRKCGEVLNEAVVAPEKPAEIMECEINACGSRTKEECDGVIISTPTGSCAHALSAGGATIEQGCEVFEITSIGSALGTKPRVVPASCETGVYVEKNSVAVLDGGARVPVKKQVVLRRGRDARLAFVRGLQRAGLRIPAWQAGICNRAAHGKGKSLPASAKLILAVLGGRQGMRQAEIARACRMPTKTVARSIKLLAKEGLVAGEGKQYRISKP